MINDSISIATISPSLLALVLQLPPGARIEAITYGGSDMSIHIRVSGADQNSFPPYQRVHAGVSEVAADIGVVWHKSS